jgi:hypothetical protein
MPKQGGTVARGYGEDHRRDRRRWKLKVDAGVVLCRRCGKLILPGEEWDLGLDDLDRSLPASPEHRRCNRATRAETA